LDQPHRSALPLALLVTISTTLKIKVQPESNAESEEEFLLEKQNLPMRLV